MKHVGKILVGILLAALAAAFVFLVYMIVLQSSWKGARRNMTVLVYASYEQPGTMEYAGRSCPTTQRALKFYYEMVMSTQSIAIRPLGKVKQTEETITLHLADGELSFTPRSEDTAEFSMVLNGKTYAYLIHTSFKWRFLVSTFEDAEQDAALPAA